MQPMDVHDYLIDQEGHDWSELLSDWGWLLPQEFTLWLVNRFGDLFLVLDDGSVHMLDVGSGTLERLADSRDAFADKIDESDNAAEWLMIPLVDACVSAGLTLGPGECYGFKHPPVLGGPYEVQNTEICDMAVHYSINGQTHHQIKDLPDGTQVNFKLGGDEPSAKES